MESPLPCALLGFKSRAQWLWTSLDRPNSVVYRTFFLMQLSQSSGPKVTELVFRLWVFSICLALGIKALRCIPFGQLSKSMFDNLDCI